MTSTSSTTSHKVLVVGSTGPTGKHVVRKLLKRGDTEVVAIARSREKLLDVLKREGGNRITSSNSTNNLIVKECSVTDLTIDELKDLTEGCTAVVSCIGHDLNTKRLFRNRYFVKETVEKIIQVMPTNCRIVLMGSDRVTHPDGTTDPKLNMFERGIRCSLRWMSNPVLDDELSAQYLYQESQKSNLEHDSDWVVVRAGDLFNKNDVESDATSKRDYEIFKHPIGGLFGAISTSHSDAAHFMSQLATMRTKTFKKTFNHKMPVVYQSEDATNDMDLDISLISTHE